MRGGHEDGPRKDEVSRKRDHDDGEGQEEEKQEDEDEEAKMQDSKQEEKESLSDLYRVPEFAELGAVFKTCRNLRLSESEAEYVVSCDKHVFQNSIVFQFHIKNTIEDCVLENVCGCF